MIGRKVTTGRTRTGRGDLMMAECGRSYKGREFLKNFHSSEKL